MKILACVCGHAPLN